MQVGVPAVSISCFALRLRHGRKNLTVGAERVTPEWDTQQHGPVWRPCPYGAVLPFSRHRVRHRETG